MAIALYMDQHVPRAITTGLRLRGVDVITAYEDGTGRMDDSELLDRAGELGRVLFTHQLRVSIGTCVHDLEIIAKAGEPGDLINRVEFLPL
jgi:hypothetical protein